MCTAAAHHHGRCVAGSTGGTGDHTDVSHTINGCHFLHCLICQCKGLLIG